MDFRFNWDASAPYAILGGVGVVGRMMYHAKLVQLGRRKPLSWALLWDVPIAVGMGWIALGVGSWLHAEWEVTVSLALVAAYLGPYGLDTAFAAYADRLKKGTDSGTPAE